MDKKVLVTGHAKDQIKYKFKAHQNAAQCGGLIVALFKQGDDWGSEFENTFYKLSKFYHEDIILVCKHDIVSGNEVIVVITVLTMEEAQANAQMSREVVGKGYSKSKRHARYQKKTKRRASW